MENTKKKEKISEEVHGDVQREIMSWLPKKSLMNRSNTRPRMLFVFCRKEFDPTPDILFHSVYQEKKPLWWSGQQQMQISNEPLDEISAPIRGLICLQSETKVVICNPNIQKFVTLPEPKATFVRSFFGYDEVSNVFKVLCTTSPENALPNGTRNFQVYTMGSGEESWRPIVCNHRHYPVTKGLCKRGVVYYGAWGNPYNKGILMSFNVKSEEFNVIELPLGVQIQHSAKLVNYNGCIALVNPSGNKLYHKGVIEMLVRNDNTGEWLEEEVVIHGWREKIGNMSFSFEGTIGLGQLVFAQNGLLDGKSFFLVYYNTNTKCLEKFNVDGGAEGGSYHFAHTFLNHVDSTSLK